VIVPSGSEEADPSKPHVESLHTDVNKATGGCGGDGPGCRSRIVQ